MQIQMTTKATVLCDHVLKEYSVTVRKEGKQWTYADALTGIEFKAESLLTILSDVKEERSRLLKAYADDIANALKGDPVMPDKLGETMPVVAGGCIRLVVTPVRDNDSTVYCCIPQRMPLWLCAPFLACCVRDIVDTLDARLRTDSLVPELTQAFTEFNKQ